jgi:hypothetical protein
MGNYMTGGGDSGLTLNTGAGINLFVNEKILLNFAYNLMWMDNGYYQDGIVHLIKAGLGFQY